MQKAEERLSNILKKVEHSTDLTINDFSHLDVVNKFTRTPFSVLDSAKVKLGILAVILSYFVYDRAAFNDSGCFLEMPKDASKLFREPENCNICENVTDVDRVVKIPALDFYEKYGKTSKPVVVCDGATNWQALKLFDFDFFKKLYETVEFKNDAQKNCQFFPYKTEFKYLEEVFQMSAERAKLKPGESVWYVGWSNCNDHAGKILQSYYDKPYFLSNNSENIALSWIFMGGPGHGAHMHVDNVRYPSWQAQLKGRKLWILAPPPECLYKCKALQTIVEPGEISKVERVLQTIVNIYCIIIKQKRLHHNIIFNYTGLIFQLDEIFEYIVEAISLGPLNLQKNYLGPQAMHIKNTCLTYYHTMDTNKIWALYKKRHSKIYKKITGHT